MEKYRDTPRKELYAALGPGRIVGGYAGFRAGGEVAPDAQLADPVAFEPGSLGPEEMTFYTVLLTGYFGGGYVFAVATRKSTEKYREFREDYLSASVQEEPLKDEKLEEITGFLEEENASDPIEFLEKKE